MTRAAAIAAARIAADVLRMTFQKGQAGIEVAKSHENRVHYYRMKNVTLSADENLIEKARLIARSQRRTLNAAFREWLDQFTASEGDVKTYDALMKSLSHVKAGGHFSRDELNER